MMSRKRFIREICFRKIRNGLSCWYSLKLEVKIADIFYGYKGEIIMDDRFRYKDVKNITSKERFMKNNVFMSLFGLREI